MSEEGKPQQRPRYKRSVKNYLLDPHFQLKYTGFLVAIAIVLSISLGMLLWRASKEIADQSQRTVQQSTDTVEQGKKTVERGKAVILESEKVNNVVQATMETCYADSPELLQAFKNDASKDQLRLIDEQKKLEADAAFLGKRAQELQNDAVELERRQNRLFKVLLAALVILVVGIGLAGIVFTHKIAGPIFKMKRLLLQVGDGKLVLRERLRKGDELQHFFEAFEKMVDMLRGHQKEEIAKLDAVLERLQKGDPAAAQKDIEALRAEMQAKVEP